MGMKWWLMELAPLAAMVMVQFMGVGLTTISKAALSKGMSRPVFVVYSNALATLILIPYALIFERNKRPPLNFNILCKFFLLSLAGITVMQNCVFAGLDYSSPTLSSAMSNLIPAFIFSLAVIFRMEKLDLRNSRSLIKILGTLVSISGALIIVLYKGPQIGTMQVPSTENTNPSSKPSFSVMLLETTNNWVIGGLFFTIACLSNSIAVISQAAILKEYPSEMTVVSFYCLFGTIQCAAFTLIAERNPNAWRFTPDIELISVLYSGITGSVLTSCLVIWSIKKKGPLFVSLFGPLGIAISALTSDIFLGENLHVGSVIGAVVIVIGFYGVIWAQWKGEKDEPHGVDKMESTLQKTPLLESQSPV
ncbi:WAT1-related protein At3g28050-like [Ziziphus jujuba]|uniref:WAT1-related protein n=1 Tax=Ziziphus jujuba TaxID=326968 RepID=A0ABM3IIT9_ZIZJJ|nr:WAT1-related protein At3g28050-like [Ziziphus jujuba]